MSRADNLGEIRQPAPDLVRFTKVFAMTARYNPEEISLQQALPRLSAISFVIPAIEKYRGHPLTDPWYKDEAIRNYASSMSRENYRDGTGIKNLRDIAYFNLSLGHLCGDLSITEKDVGRCWQVQTRRRRGSETFFSKEQEKAALERQGGRCYCCDTEFTFVGYQADHIHPFSQGGPTVVQNCALLCVACHERKGTKPMALLMKEIWKEIAFNNLRARKVA